jgi:hypothetical protein
VFLALELNRAEKSALWPTALPLGEEHQLPMGRGLGGFKAGLVEKENLLLLLERFNSQFIT